MDEPVELDVEDLFNEDPGLDDGALDNILPPADHPALQPQTIAPAPAVVERILSLKYCGCLKRVAWNASGHITSISEDGSTVNLQCLRLIPGTAQWKLTAAKPLNRVFEDAVSLSWSATGVELAVMDSRGRVYIYNMSPICLNMLDEMRESLPVPEGEQSQPVVSVWLNADRPDKPPRTVVLNVTKSNDRWVQSSAKAKSFGPHFARAFFMATKNGILSLIYPRPDGLYRRHSMQLPISVKTTFAHGAIVATPEGTLMMALYTSERKLILYRVQFQQPGEWKANPSDSAHPKIIVEIINADVPISNLSPETGEVDMGNLYYPEDTMLTHLDIIPTSDTEGSAQNPPQIWGVYASVNHNLSVTEPGYLRSSFIRRWNVTPTQRKLHPKFEEMSTKAEVHGGNLGDVSVDSLPITQFPQIITNLELLDNGQMVMITTTDGQVEMWNPISMTPASFDSDPNQATSLIQSSFSFSPSPALLLVTASPNASSAIIQTADQSLSLGQALYLGQPSKGLDISNPQESVAASALILAFARASYSNSNSDDILSCINFAYQRDHKSAFLKRMYSVAFPPVVFINEKAPNSHLERMTTNPLAQKALSLQLAFYASSARQPLQPNGFPHPSTWSRMWAWITLNLRHISMSLSHLFSELQTPQQKSQPTLLAPSYLETICNLIRYTIDLYRFIYETILEVGDRQSNPDMFDDPISSPCFNLGDEKGDGSQGLVALLLNCNWSRFALSTTARPLLFLMSKADPSNPNIRYIGDAIRRFSIGRGLSLSAAQWLFNGQWYRGDGLTKEGQYDTNMVASRQMEMMSTGVVGEQYQKTIQDLLNNAINSEKGILNIKPPEISRLKLFTDTPEISWILLNMDRHIPTSPATKSAPSPLNPQKLYDVYKKAPIPVIDPTGHRSTSRQSTRLTGVSGLDAGDDGVQMVRRCTRCGSLSEDIRGSKPEWPKFSKTQHSRCVCDGYWIVEPLRMDETKVDQ